MTNTAKKARKLPNQVRLMLIPDAPANLVPGGLRETDLYAALYALELWATEPNPPDGIPRDDEGTADRLRKALAELAARS